MKFFFESKETLKRWEYGHWAHIDPNAADIYVVLCRISWAFLLGLLNWKKNYIIEVTSKHQKKQQPNRRERKTSAKRTKKKDTEKKVEENRELLDLLYEWVINSYII